MIHATDAHLLPLETAARAYMERLEQNPDEAIPGPHPDGLMVPYHRPAWLFAADKLLDLQMMLVSLREAAPQKPAIVTQ